MKKVALEGFWQVGKSTMLEWLQTSQNFIVINEPDHTKDEYGQATDDLNNWYWAAHYNNLLKMVEYSYGFDGVVMERTAASTLAFMNSIKPNCLETERVIGRYIESEEAKLWRQVQRVIVLYVEIEEYRQYISKLPSFPISIDLLCGVGFLERYLKNLYNYLGALVGSNSITTINVFENGKFRSLENIQNEVTMHLVS